MRKAAGLRVGRCFLLGWWVTSALASADGGEIRDHEPSPKMASSRPALGPPVEPAKFRYRREIPVSPPGLTSLLLDAAVLSHSPNLADLRIVDAQGLQIPYLPERREEPLSLRLPAPVRQAQAGDPPSLSRYRLDLPYPALPEARLVFATTARVFERAIRLVEVSDAAAPTRQEREPGVRIVAEALWRHADPDSPAPRLTLDLPQSPAIRFDLLVDEGDNPPLPLAPPHLLLPAHRLRFFYPASQEGTLKLLYGRPGLPSPRYDLALLAPRLLGEATREIALGPELHPGKEPDVAVMGSRIFWGALVGTVLMLLVVLGRLLRRTPTGAV